MFARSIVILSRSVKNPPDCHSEPLGEESRFVYFYFVLLEILRFAQDDKLGFVYPTVGAGFHARPIVILSRSAKNLVSHILYLGLRSFAIAQDDKLGFVYPTVGAGFHARPRILL